MFQGETFSACLEEDGITFFPKTLYEEALNTPYTATCEGNEYTIASTSTPDQLAIEKLTAQIQQLEGGGRLSEPERRQIELMKDILAGMGKAVKLEFE